MAAETRFDNASFSSSFFFVFVFVNAFMTNRRRESTQFGVKIQFYGAVQKVKCLNASENSRKPGRTQRKQTNSSD